jgi:hypothetical protein
MAATIFILSYLGKRYSPSSSCFDETNSVTHQIKVYQDAVEPCSRLLKYYSSYQEAVQVYSQLPRFSYLNLSSHQPTSHKSTSDNPGSDNAVQRSSHFTGFFYLGKFSHTITSEQPTSDNPIPSPVQHYQNEYSHLCLYQEDVEVYIQLPWLQIWTLNPTLHYLHHLTSQYFILSV